MIKTYKILSKKEFKLIKLIDKNKIHFWRKGKNLEIHFGSYYDAGQFCTLLNKIGDENWRGKE